MDRVKKIYSKDVWIVVFHLKFNFNNDPKEKKLHLQAEYAFQGLPLYD